MFPIRFVNCMDNRPENGVVCETKQKHPSSTRGDKLMEPFGRARAIVRLVGRGLECSSRENKGLAGSKSPFIRLFRNSPGLTPFFFFLPSLRCR